MSNSFFTISHYYELCSKCIDSLCDDVTFDYFRARLLLSFISYIRAVTNRV